MKQLLSEKRLISAAVSVFIVLALLRPSLSGGRDLYTVVNESYARGELDREQYYRALLYAVYAPDRLSSGLTAEAVEPMRCGTHILAEIREQAPTLSSEFRSMLASYEVRPQTEFEFASPGGMFRLHFDTAYGSPTAPVPIEDLDLDSVPDFVEDMASYADSAWQHITETMGYHTPPSDGSLGGDSLYDIYFSHFQFYGITFADNQTPDICDQSFSSHIRLHHTFVSFPPNQDPEGSVKGSMKVAIAHELYHAVQFAYDAYLDPWWAEQTAVWMEDEVYPGIHDNYNYFDDFWPVPQYSLLEEGIPLHMYGSFVWPKFLAQNLGKDLMLSVLERTCYNASAMSALQSELTALGTSLTEQFTKFLFWNYRTGDRDDGNHYEDGADYPEISVMRNHTAIPALNQGTTGAPYNLGSNYIRVDNDSAYVGILTFRVDTCFTAAWALSYVTVDTMGVYETESVYVPPNGRSTVFVGLIQHYQSVVFIPYLKGSGYGGPFGYWYSLLWRPIGDADASLNIDIDDIIFTINFIFGGGPASNPVEAMDANCSGWVDIDDVVYLIMYVFAGGPAPCGEGQA
jgi:hypothetical protein